jgi:hypothetical protein
VRSVAAIRVLLRQPGIGILGYLTAERLALIFVVASSRSATLTVSRSICWEGLIDLAGAQVDHHRPALLVVASSLTAVPVFPLRRVNDQRPESVGVVREGVTAI